MSFEQGFIMAYIMIPFQLILITSKIAVLNDRIETLKQLKESKTT